MKRFNVNVKLDLTKKDTTLIQDLEYNQYTLVIGQDKAKDKSDNMLEQLNKSVLNKLQREYPNQDIKVNLIVK